MSLLDRPGDAPARGRGDLGGMRREFVLSPITALAFYWSSANDRLYTLAGEDNHINVYDTEDSRLCGQIDIFPAQSVHGIVVSTDDDSQRRILVWGGYSLAFILGEAVDDVISGHGMVDSESIVVAEASDWIFEGVISPHTSDELALLTAHNDLIRARYDATQGRVDFLETVSPSRPILYSGNILWEEPDCILVAAGTVFGEIVVWKYTATQSSSERQSQTDVLFVFSGHEGSIFGVHISPIFTLETGESLRLLASCSDDRTIRIWDITDSHDLSGGTRDEYQQKILAIRQTGFGDSIETESPEEDSARCLAVAMGHVSRIWQVEFARSQSLASTSTPIEIWSFGEDATAQKWSLSLGTPLASGDGHDTTSRTQLPTRTKGQLTNEVILSNHSGKNIWSHALVHNKTGQLFVVTGASDGKISIIGSKERATTEHTLADVPPVQEVLPSIEDETSGEPSTNSPDKPDLTSEALETTKADNGASEDGVQTTTKVATKKKKVKKLIKDFFNRYALLSDGSILASTKTGRFFVASATRNSAWEQLYLPDQFKDTSNYSIVKGSYNASVAYIGTAEGNVFTYRTDAPLRLEHLATVHGKISDIFTLPPSTLTNCDADEPRKIRILITVLGSDTASLLEFDDAANSKSQKQLDIPVDKRFIVTSAVLHEDLLILGSRTGFVSILKVVGDGSYREESLVEPKTNDCVTSITILPPKNSKSMLHFLTTSRDGKFRIYTMENEQESTTVSLIHETSPPFGPIIEGAWLTTNGDGSIDLILYGFRSTKFVVWNETQRREIAAIECGGGHRTFVYDRLRGSSDGFRLVWTQASQLSFFSQTHTPHKALKLGGHGREIKAISSSGMLFATAAEDTAIRIWSRPAHDTNSGSTIRCLAVLEDHTAGIQSMKWHKQSHLFSSAGNKEFYVWRISHLNSRYQGLAVRCEAGYPDRTEDKDLRITNFDVHCLDESSPEGSSFYISMTLSNSTLLTYTYSEAAGFELIAKGSYTGACMTQIRHLHVDDTVIQTVTAATDGHLTVWETKLATRADGQLSDHSSILVTKVHQSTIKSLDIRVLPVATGTSYLVATGGDDDGIGVTHLHRDKSVGSYLVKSKSIVRSAHAAAVTGLAILNLSSEDRNAVLVSCSNDQRVKRWEVVGWQDDVVRVRLLDNRYSAIADAGDLEIMVNAKRFVVGGVGLEIWDVDNEEGSSMSKTSLGVAE